MIDLKNMSKNTKLEVALEILSSKIASEYKKGNTIESDKIKNLLKERTMMYNGDEEIINKIIEEYAPEVKKMYEEA